MLIVVVIVVGLVLAVAALIAVFEGGSLDRNHARATRAGHIADDSNCVYWLGDFAGVNLRARCPICSPDTKKKK